MAAGTKSRVTTDHEEIRRWAKARSGKPAIVVRPKSDDDHVGRIRIYLPHNRNEGSLREISWAKWFKQFDAAGLAFLYQEQIAGGEKSTFNELVSRKCVDEVQSAVGGKGRSASRKRSRRDREAGAIAPTANAGPRSGSRGAGSHQVSKQSTATAGTVTTAPKSHLTRNVSRSSCLEASSGSKAKSTTRTLAQSKS